MHDEILYILALIKALLKVMYINIFLIVIVDKKYCKRI